METRQIEQDIQIIYLQASSFPAGIDTAWQDFFKLIPNAEKRTTYFGYSHMQADELIVYRVGTPLLADDDPKQFDIMVIPKGKYISRTLENYMEKRDQFATIFQDLLTQDGVDQRFGLEWYESKTIAHCMVPLAIK